LYCCPERSLTASQARRGTSQVIGRGRRAGRPMPRGSGRGAPRGRWWCRVSWTPPGGEGDGRRSATGVDVGPTGRGGGPGIPVRLAVEPRERDLVAGRDPEQVGRRAADRKSTRLNSSHVKTSYAVFCSKKKNDFVAPTDLLHFSG